ncbi:MAG: hypothetical protein ABIT23_08715 [Nitrosospira sp.]
MSSFTGYLEKSTTRVKALLAAVTFAVTAGLPGCATPNLEYARCAIEKGYRNSF